MAIAIRVGPSCVRQEKGQPASKCPAETDAEKHRSDPGIEDVMRAHGDATGRHRRPANALRRMGEEALEDRGAQAGPDQAFGNVRLRSIELMQVRVRCPEDRPD